MTRMAFIHTGAVVIPTIDGLAAEHLPGVEIHHLLDSAIVGDLRAGANPADIRARLGNLASAAKRAGSEAVMFSCSSISGYAADVAADVGIPVLRIDEAMADEAVNSSARVAVIATLPTTLAPTVALLRERAELAGRTVDIAEVLVHGAFEAVVSGDRARHDELVGAAIAAQAENVDSIVLAQASMASAAATAPVGVPVLTSPELGVKRAASALR
ncbi:aspartate/glutamate racemase family protein [Leucobacter sp. wl10]|uniref:aspartate/glutamate racemase family protein n=1 Tax=Leucobacter sp. wl10 TaxID=2304677 RepID=UPI000E5BE8A2|nr:aspartate/glutamate racemase family protein [Leucobacter sp. wl10]RGE18561.1 hypothetical protein D1J51_14830 [Leucobacter sp. wl10]